VHHLDHILEDHKEIDRAALIFYLGISVVNLGALMGFQQAVLFVQMLLGNIVAISLIAVVVKRYYFRKEFTKMMKDPESRERVERVLQKRKMKDTHEKPEPGSDQASDTPHNDNGMTSRKTSRKKAEDNGKSQEKSSRSESREHLIEHHEEGFGGIPQFWQTNTFRNIVRKPWQSKMEKHKDPGHPDFQFEPDTDHKV